MVILILVLIFTSLYFAVRFFLIRKSIQKMTHEFMEIEECYGSNRYLHLTSPDPMFEKFLVILNQHILKTQQERIHFQKKEQSIRTEISNVSHDLRTPLTSIVGYLELIKSMDISEVEKEEYLDVVMKRSKNLQSLIEQFYDLSRLNDKSYSIEIETIDLHRILCDYILDYYAVFESKGIEVEMDMEDKPLLAKGDVNAVGRILNNLIGNALKYSGDTLIVSLKKQNEKVVIIFKNLAYPLTEDDVKHLFDRFYMKDSARNSNSSGLGLTIAKLLTEALGGSMEAQILGEWLEIRAAFSTK